MLPGPQDESEIESYSIDVTDERENQELSAFDTVLMASQENSAPLPALTDHEYGVTLQNVDDALLEEAFRPIDRVVKVSFEFDSAAITEQSSLVLDRSFDLLGATEDSPVSITGYADSRGSKAYNLNLSQKRASAVARYLVDKGISASRLAVGGGGVYAPDTKEGSTSDSSESELYRFVQIEFGR